MKLLGYVLLGCCLASLLATDTDSLWSRWYHKTTFDLSLAYNELMGKASWSKIGNLNLYLGTLPVDDKNQIKQMSRFGINRILTMVEPSPSHMQASRHIWNENGITAFEFPAPCSLPIPQDQLQAGVSFLHDELEHGNTIYIHYTSGIGRSVAILTGYFMKYNGMTPSEAINHIKKYRPHVDISPIQASALIGFGRSLSLNE